MLTQKSKEHCKVCNHRLTKNGHCLSCARRGNKNRARGKTYPAPPAPPAPQAKPENKDFIPSALACCKCHATTPIDLLKNTPAGMICPTCAGVFDRPAPKTGAGFQEVPGVGEYCPEPAAATIHASQPPKPEPIKINEIDVCRQVINRHGISRQLAKAAEEFSEAAAAISRFLAGEGEYTEIVGEVADVEVMCVQMRLIYGTDGIDQARVKKVARLHKRLNP